MVNIRGSVDYDEIEDLKGTGDKDFTTLESDIESILDQLDLKISELRDALRGTGNKTLTDLETDLSNILSQLDVTLSTRASEATLSDVKANTDNLDISLSTHRDALKPTRASPTKDLSSQSITAGGVQNIDKSGLDGYSVLMVIVKATYNSSATQGVRVRWLYSPDGTNYDSPEDAEDAGNYEDLTFSAGATRERTILIPVLTDNIRVQIVNLDSSYSVTVDVWTQPMR